MRSTAKRYLSLHLAAIKNDHETKTNKLSRGKVDTYRAILGSTLPKLEKKPEHVATEILTLLVGGSATIIRVMSRIVFLVISTPQVLDHLKRELDAIMAAPNVHPALEVLEQQPYLVRTKVF